MPTKIIQRIQVTKMAEQVFILLLALHDMGNANSLSEITQEIGNQNLWRGIPPAWDEPWQDQCLRREYVIETKNGYALTDAGIGKINDFSYLTKALHNSFKHLSTPANQRAQHIIKKINKDPFTNKRTSQIAAQERRGEFHIYVILLSDSVLNEYPKLVDLNPNRKLNCPYLYVGYTSQTPTIRLQQHRLGKGASGMVTCYNICLVPDLYAHLNPIYSKDEAVQLEKQHAKRLRAQGYTVYAGHHDWLKKDKLSRTNPQKTVITKSSSLKSAFQPPNGNYSQRLKQILALRHPGNEDEIRTLIAALDDENDTIRWQVTTTLSKQCGPRIVKLLNDYLATNPRKTTQEAIMKLKEQLSEK